MVPITFGSQRLLEIAEQSGPGLPQAPLFQQMGAKPVEFTGSWLARAGLPMLLQKSESVAVFSLTEIA